MKKLAKILVLFLVMALIAGAFAFNAFADDVATTTVGTYDKAAHAPNGLEASQITGAEGYNVTFATWKTEASYQNGDQPEYWYTTDTTAPAANQALAGLQDANVGKTAFAKDGTTPIGYVHFFADVTSPKNTTALPSAQLTTGISQRLVINLAGHTWTTYRGIRPGDSSGGNAVKQYLEIKNGTYQHNDGQMQYRGDSTTVWKNVIYNIPTYVQMSYGSGAELLMFEDCILNLGANAEFAIGPNTKSPFTTNVIFKNTDLIQAGNPSKSLFTISRNQYNYTAAVNIIFDKDSSVQRANNNYITLNDAVTDTNSYPLTYTQGLYFEMGCEFSMSAIPSYSMSYNHKKATSTTVDETTTWALVDTPSVANKDGGFLEVAVIKPVEGGIKYTVPTDTAIVSVSGVNVNLAKTAGAFSSEAFAANENYYQVGGFVNVTAASGLQTFIVPTGGAWVPGAEHAGIVYGVWATENDYLNGAAPTKWYDTGDLLTANLGTTDSNGSVYQDPNFVPGYVRAYGALNNTTAQIVTGQAQKLVIDLAGNTLNDTKGFRVGGNFANHPDAYFEIKNGVVENCTGQWQTRPATTAVYKGVTFNVNKTNQESLLQDGGALLIWFDNCTINFTSPKAGMTKATSSTGDTELRFTKTTINHNLANSTTALVNAYNTTGSNTLKITFDADSVVNGAHNRIICLGTTNNASNKEAVVVEFALGFECSGAFAPDSTYFYGTYNSDDGTIVDTTSESSVVKVNVIDANGAAVENWYAVKQENGNVEFVDNFDVYLYKIVEYGKVANVVLNTWTEAKIDTGAKGVAYVHGNGSTIVFYDDAEIADFATFYNYDLTLDLNGHTVTRTSKNDIQFGAGNLTAANANLSGSLLPRTITIKNGTFVGMAGANSVLQARPGSSVYLKDLTINVPQHLFNDGGIAALTIENCTINSTNGGNVVNRAISSVAFNNSTGNCDIMLKGATLNNIGLFNCTSPVVDTINITITGGSTIANNRRFINLSEAATTTDPIAKTVNVKIDLNTKYTSYETLNCVVADTTVYKLTIGYYTDIAGSAVDASGYVFYKNGDHFLYGAKPAMPAGALQANLTLYTDFTLNFFANKNVIAGIYRNGKAVESSAYGDLTKYSIPEINANEAAEDIELYVVVISSDIEYYVPLSYSPLKYANTVVKTGSTVTALGQQLATAAMNYVKAAYAYAGLENAALAAFTGVATENAVPGTTQATTLPDLIAGAQLSIGDDITLRFTLAEGKSGNLTVGDANYVVENGKVGELNFVEVNMRAYNLYNAEITVSDGTTTGTYSLAHYVNAVNADVNSTETLKTLVNALYTYTKYAHEYKALGVLN